MSGWYSKILTTTTSQISTLRGFLGGENDGDTEDDTHVCRVLRAYYTEKGRPFPTWLPPDPKAPPPVQPVLLHNNSIGSRYGGLSQQQGGGGLSSLWDNNPAPQQQEEPQSLRKGRGGPQQRLNPFSRNSDPSAGGRDDVPARPLPSQRAGSYQTTSTAGRETAPPASSGSAQDRLRQRLWGGSRTASPAPSGPFNPPAQHSSSRSGGSGDYEDRFAPGGMHDSSKGGRGGDRPFMAANSPWASNENEYSGGGGGGGGRSSRRQGLPSGPRGMR